MSNQIPHDGPAAHSKGEGDPIITLKMVEAARKVLWGSGKWGFENPSYDGTIVEDMLRAALEAEGR